MNSSLILYFSIYKRAMSKYILERMGFLKSSLNVNHQPTYNMMKNYLEQILITAYGNIKYLINKESLWYCIWIFSSEKSDFWILLSHIKSIPCKFISRLEIFYTLPLSQSSLFGRLEITFVTPIDSWYKSLSSGSGNEVWCFWKYLHTFIFKH